MELETYLKKTADEVNSLLQDWYGDPKSPLSQAANHLLFAGGNASVRHCSNWLQMPYPPVRLTGSCLQASPLR